MTQKIEQEYPGFKAKTNKQQFRKRVQAALRQYPNDSFKAYAKIVDFFHDRHLFVAQRVRHLRMDTATNTAQLASIQAYLQTRKSFRKYEGYWINDYQNCIIGIRQFGADSLVAYTIDHKDSSTLRPGQIYGKFSYTAPRHYWVDGIGVNAGSRYFVHAHFRNDSVFTMEADCKWRKLKEPVSLSLFPDYNFLPTGKRLDSGTYLITIPISLRSNVPVLDSILKEDSAVIVQCKNLIIDVRNNQGGSSAMIAPLIPFVYSQPIVRPRAWTYCTSGSIAQMEDTYKQYLNAHKELDIEVIRTYEYWIAKMKRNRGGFIIPPADTIRRSKDLDLPKNIGILANYGSQSAAELLILTLSQSSKVTLFGENTRGAVDYLDFYPLWFDENKIALMMPTTRRYIGKGDRKLDNMGIAPQVPISDTTTDWITFIKNYYETRWASYFSLAGLFSVLLSYRLCFLWR